MKKPEKYDAMKDDETTFKFDPKTGTYIFDGDDNDNGDGDDDDALPPVIPLTKEQIIRDIVVNNDNNGQNSLNDADIDKYNLIKQKVYYDEHDVQLKPIITSLQREIDQLPNPTITSN